MDCAFFLTKEIMGREIAQSRSAHITNRFWRPFWAVDNLVVWRLLLPLLFEVGVRSGRASRCVIGRTVGGFSVAPCPMDCCSDVPGDITGF